MSSVPPSSPPNLSGDDPYGPIFDPPVPPESDPFGLMPWNRRLRKTVDAVLEWDNEKGCFKVWPWPLHHLLIVPPQDLVAHRQLFDFTLPCCLCARDSLDPKAITEASVFCMPSGGLAGQIVAMCARNNCKYFVKLETIFRNTSSPSFVVKEYPPRTIRGPAPARIPFYPETFTPPTSSPASASANKAGPSSRKRTAKPTVNTESESSKRAGKRRKIDVPGLETWPMPVPPIVPSGSTLAPGSYLRAMSPPPASEASLFTLLMCLDDGGLSMREFQHLFVVCKLCHDWVGTKSSMEKHYCSRHRFPESPAPLIKQEEDVIDLTGAYSD